MGNELIEALIALGKGRISDSKSKEGEIMESKKISTPKPKEGYPKTKPKEAGLEDEDKIPKGLATDMKKEEDAVFGSTDTATTFSREKAEDDIKKMSDDELSELMKHATKKEGEEEEEEEKKKKVEATGKEEPDADDEKKEECSTPYKTEGKKKKKSKEEYKVLGEGEEEESPEMKQIKALHSKMEELMSMLKSGKTFKSEEHEEPDADDMPKPPMEEEAGEVPEDKQKIPQGFRVKHEESVGYDIKADIRKALIKL